MRTLPLLLALALLGGCLGSPDAETAAVQNAAVDAAADASANATADAAPAGPAERIAPFAFEGNTGTWACAPSGPDSCTGLPTGVDSENTFAPLEYEGNASAVTAMLTWTASTPATDTMYISVFAVRSCGEGCFEATEESYWAVVEGVSPLALDATGIELAPEETLYIHVGVASHTPQPPVPFFYGVDQAFSLEGTVTSSV